MKNKILTNFLKIFFIFSFVYLFTTGFLYASSNPYILNAIHLATTVKKEAFTELYFEDHLNLPKQVDSSEKYSFKFTVHNLEGKDMKYIYDVYLDIGNEKLFLDKGTIFLKNNGYKTMQEVFTKNGSLSKGKIIVNLVNKNQQIAFWIEGENTK